MIQWEPFTQADYEKARAIKDAAGNCDWNVRIKGIPLTKATRELAKELNEWCSEKIRGPICFDVAKELKIRDLWYASWKPTSEKDTILLLQMYYTSILQKYLEMLLDFFIHDLGEKEVSRWTKEELESMLAAPIEVIVSRRTFKQCQRDRERREKENSW